MIGMTSWQKTLVKKWRLLLLAGVAVTTLGACGPGLDSLAPYGIGGTVTGLTGTLVLQNNGADNLSLSTNGSFKFSKELASNATYSVTVLNQPIGQFCTVISGSDTATAEVTTVSVQCTWTGTKQLGELQGDTYGRSVATDASGNVFVAGYTTGALDGNPREGSSDLFVTKYSSSGVKRLTVQLGGLNAAGVAAATEGLAVAIGAGGNVYVVGYTNGALVGIAPVGSQDFFIAKFDNDLSPLNRAIVQVGVPGAFTVGRSVAVDACGNVYVTGDTTGNLSNSTLLGANRSDFFVTKFDSNLANPFIVQLGVADNTSVVGNSITTDASCNVVYVAGSTTGALPGATQVGDSDFFVAKFDNNLNRLGIAQLGVTVQETFGNSVVISPNGSVYVAGTTSGALPGAAQFGDTDFFIAKFDSDLGLLNRKIVQVGVPATVTFGNSVTTDSRGNVYVAGETSGALDSNTRTITNDFFVTKFSGSLVQQFVQQMGVTGVRTAGYSVVTDVSGNVYVAGETSGALDGNARTRVTSDFFLTKYNSNFVK
jgi:hypothetical protein